MGSTNDALLQALSGAEEVPHGAVYITDDQTAGRGQGANRWHSSPGDNLTFSMLVMPDQLSVDRIFALTQYASLAVHRGLTTMLPTLDEKQLRVKWPNDLYAGNRKLGGILIQNGLRGSGVQWSVIGVGLNVNEREFPPELQRSATSLYHILGEAVDRSSLLEHIFAGFTYWYDELETQGFDRLHAAYHERLYRLGERHRFRRVADDEVFTAVVQGTDGRGHLRLVLDDAQLETFELRSIQWLPA